MIAVFIHRIDPVLADIGGLYFWWYGLGYSLGFLEIHCWLRHTRGRLGLTMAEVYRLSVLLMLGVLMGGRLVEVACYEWPFYRQHPWWIPALWLGGMATHGLLLGAVGATWLFCRWHRRPLLAVLDELVIPGALLMGLGRLGNFIDGQIVGSPTDVWWAVQFPDTAGFRHPVVLYDGLKNLLLVPWLLWWRARGVSRGVLTAQFIFWYGFLRIFVDLFREYPTTLLGLATGQSLNLAMALLGAGLWLWASGRATAPMEGAAPPHQRASMARPSRAAGWPLRMAWVALLVCCAVIPSDWTQDVPVRYGQRHPGLRHSIWYPDISGGEESSYDP